MKLKSLIITSLAACAATTVFGQIAVDGTADSAYGTPLAVQGIGTGFGDSNLGQQFFANGSELDQLYARVYAGKLYVVFAGNVESNFNKFELFIDSISGGQNRLRNDNSGVSFGGLLRMGDDGSGNGLTFDNGYDADFWLSITGGDVGGGNYGAFVDGATLLTAGGGQGEFLGGVNLANGSLSGGTNYLGASANINNSNTAGVDGSNGGVSSGAGVTTGVEMCVPLSALGNPTSNIKIMGFINGGGHDFASNQFLPALPAGTSNLGEPRAINLNSQAGDQFVSVSVPGNYAPVSDTLITGTPFGGDLASLANSDDNQYFILNDENDPNAELNLGYTVNETSASNILVYVEFAATRADQSVFVSLKNQTSGAYVGIGNFSASLTDTTRYFDVPNASVYRGTAGQVDVKIRVVPTQDLESADGWAQVIDLARIEVTP